MSSSRTAKTQRTFLNVEVVRDDIAGLREIASDQAKELQLRVTVSDITRQLIRKAVESHREGKRVLVNVA